MNELVKEGHSNLEYSQMDDQKVMGVLDKLLPQLLHKDHHKLVFGYPRNLTQIHHMRKLNLYPHKVFLINSNLESAASRLSQKLFAKDKPETSAEKHRVDQIIQEYLL